MSLKVYLMATLDNYMFRPILAIFRLWYPDAGFSPHPDTTPPQSNHNITPTHIEPEQYNP